MSVVGLAFGLALYVPQLANPDWVEITVNQDSLAYQGTMILDYLMPRWMTYVISLSLIILPPAISTYFHMRWFALTIVAVVVVDILLLLYAYISFFCLLVGLGTLRLIYVIARNKCARECPVLFARIRTESLGWPARGQGGADSSATVRAGVRRRRP